MGTLTAMGKLPRWTDLEVQHLRDHYPGIDTERLRELLPNRSRMSIRSKACYMGIKKCPEKVAEIGRVNVMKRWDKVLAAKEPLSNAPVIQA